MKTIDRMFEECKMLSDDELRVLMNGLQSEIDDRRVRAKKESWKMVVDAINAYTEEYGAIEILDYDHCIFIHAKGFAHTLGEISVG